MIFEKRGAKCAFYDYRGLDLVRVLENVNRFEVGDFWTCGSDQVKVTFEDGSELITGRFIGDGFTYESFNNDFELVTDDFEETFARAGFGLGFVLKSNKQAYVTVDADLGRDLLKTYYFNAGFRCLESGY